MTPKCLVWEARLQVLQEPHEGRKRAVDVLGRGSSKPVQFERARKVPHHLFPSVTFRKRRDIVTLNVSQGTVERGENRMDHLTEITMIAASLAGHVNYAGELRIGVLIRRRIVNALLLFDRKKSPPILSHYRPRLKLVHDLPKFSSERPCLDERLNEIVSKRRGTFEGSPKKVFPNDRLYFGPKVIAERLSVRLFKPVPIGIVWPPLGRPANSV
jgi:hypothetical protein